MNRDEAMASLKKTINILLGKTEEAEVKLTDVKTKDGKTISSPADKLDIGVEVYTVDDQGNQIPAEDGEYVLEDGTNVTILGGVVTEIEAASEEAVEDAELSDEDKKKAEDDAKAKEEADKKKKEEDAAADSSGKVDENPDTEARISKLEKEVADLIAMIQSVSQNSQTLQSKVEEFASQPGAEAIKNKKVIERQLTAEELRVQRFLNVKNSLPKN